MRDRGREIERGQDVYEETERKSKIIILRYRHKNMLEVLTGES